MGTAEAKAGGVDCDDSGSPIFFSAPQPIMQANVNRAEFQAFIEKLLPNVDQLTPNQQHQLYLTLTKIKELDKLQDARDHLLTFMEFMWPGFIQSWHHVVICNTLESMERGDLLRAAISTPPRYTKSQTLSIYFPAWVMGRTPGDVTKIIQAGNTAELARRFGRFCKNVIESPQYGELFPKAKISSDSKASHSFTLTEGAEYYATGVGGALAGRGATYLLVDDPFSEQDIISGNAAELFEKAEEWYMGALQRQQPGGRACVLHTRWSKLDLIGRLEDRMRKSKSAEKYKIISIPALDEKDESTFPGYWKTPMLKQMRSTLMERTPHMWWAQYMQQPTSDSMSIVKREWWKKWEKMNSKGEYLTPPCGFTLMVFDTAYTAKKRSNPSACTVWGVWKDENDSTSDPYRLILLHSFQRKMELPELKDVAVKLVKEWKPDCVLVEAKSSGPWVLEEFRLSGIQAQGVIPKPGEDKMTRLNSVTDVFASGNVYYIPTAANEETVQQCADFPGGSGDDLVDTVAYAIRRFRKGGLVSTQHDLQEIADDTVVDRAFY